MTVALFSRKNSSRGVRHAYALHVRNRTKLILSDFEGKGGPGGGVTQSIRVVERSKKPGPIRGILFSTICFMLYDADCISFPVENLCDTRL